MSRLWSILFFLVPVAGITAFVFAANQLNPLAYAWLPENFSESGVAIDNLFYLVHWICAMIFVGIGLLIGFVIWKFASPQRKRADFYRDNIRLELVWSIIPGIILVWLAFHQMYAWSAQRVQRPTIQVGDQTIPKPPLVRIFAKQFGWEFQYSGEDKRFDTVDDISIENLMVVPDDESIVLQLESRDVIHSFFVPKLRLKQDVVPGMVQVVWFTPTSNATMSIVCAELCGWGHYKMNAELRIVPRNEFDSWIRDQQLRIAPPEFQTRQGN